RDRVAEDVARQRARDELVDEPRRRDHEDRGEQGGMDEASGEEAAQGWQTFWSHFWEQHWAPKKHWLPGGRQPHFWLLHWFEQHSLLTKHESPSPLQLSSQTLELHF